VLIGVIRGSPALSAIHVYSCQFVVGVTSYTLALRATLAVVVLLFFFLRVERQPAYRDHTRGDENDQVLFNVLID